jgi:hypothetical protein
MRLYISDGRTNALALLAEAGDSGVCVSVGDIAVAGVLRGGGIAEGEKSRRFSGFSELSLVAEGAKLAALACRTPAL